MLGTVNGYHRGAGIGFGHTSIFFKNYYLGPNLIINLFPLCKHFIDVILKKKLVKVLIWKPQYKLKVMSYLRGITSPDRAKHLPPARLVQ